MQKLFLTWLLYAAITLVLSLMSWKLIWDFRIGSGENIWNETWKFSLLKSSTLIYLSSGIISSLVQEAVKKEDAVVLMFTSPINRSSMLAAKIASFFTYYWVSNFLFSLPIIFLSAGSSWDTTLIFLLFDSLLLALVTFLLFHTPIFYLCFPTKKKKLKFLVFFLYLVLLFSFFLLATTQSVEIFKSPWIPILLSFPVGLGFLSLYWNDFRQHDYT